MRVGIRETVEALKWEINFLCTVASASGFCDMNPACLGTQATVLICGCQNPSCVAFTEVRLMCTLASKSCDLKPKPYFFFSLIYCFCTASLTVFYESIKGYWDDGCLIGQQTCVHGGRQMSAALKPKKYVVVGGGGIGCLSTLLKMSYQ